MCGICGGAPRNGPAAAVSARPGGRWSRLSSPGWPGRQRFGSAALAPLGAGLDGLGGPGLAGGAERWRPGRGPAGPPAAIAPASPAMPIGEVDATAAGARSTGVDELDRVLGGGVVPGAVVLLAGEPGVGKSTLLLEAAPTPLDRGRCCDHRRRVHGTGPPARGPDRRARPGPLPRRRDRPVRRARTCRAGPAQLLILDSVQTIASSEVDGVPGGVTQVREVAAALIRVAKERDWP